MAEIDYSKWIVNYNGEVPAENVATAFNFEYSNGLYEIFTTGTQAYGNFDTSPVYAIAGEHTAIANSIFTFSTAFNESEKEVTITFKKQAPTSANIYSSADNLLITSGVGLNTYTYRPSGGIPITSDGMANYVNNVDKFMAYVSSSGAQQYNRVFPRFITETSTNYTTIEGRQNSVMLSQPFNTTILSVRVQLFIQGGETITPPYSTNSFAYYYLDSIRDSLVSILGDNGVDLLLERGYATGNNGYTYSICAVSVTPVTRSVLTSTRLSRNGAPFIVQNVSGTPYMIEPYSNSGGSTIGMQGRFGSIRYYKDTNTMVYSAEYVHQAADISLTNQLCGYGMLCALNGDLYQSTTSGLYVMNGNVYAPMFMNVQGTESITFDTYWNSTAAYKNTIVESDSGNIKMSVIIGNDFIEFLPIFTYETIVNFVSSLGMYWSGTQLAIIASDYNVNDYPSIAEYWTAILTDNRVRLGHIDENGVTDGTYTVGDGNREGIQNEWNTIADSPATPIDPSIPPDTTDDDDGDIFLSTDVRGGVSTDFVSYYALMPFHVSALGAYIWGNQTAFENVLGNFMLRTGTDYAISMGDIAQYFALRYFPFSVRNLFGSTARADGAIYAGTGVHALTVGATVPGTSVSAQPYNLTSTTAVINAGTVALPRLHNNFLDYEPYTDVIVQVPFCGACRLKPSQVIGSTLQVYYNIDAVTGNMMAVIMKTGIAIFPIAYLHGKCGFDVPLTGNNAVQLAARNALQRKATLDQGVSNFGSTLLQGGGYVGGLISAATGVYNSMSKELYDFPLTNQLNVYTSENADDASSLIQPRRAYVTVTTRNPSNPINYAHTNGNVYSGTHILSSLSGFTVCQNPDLSGIPAQSDELAEIKNLLESGVYL